MRKIWSMMLVASLVLACNKDDNDVASPGSNNQEELITTVQIQFYNMFGQLADEAIFRDVDGPGGEAPSQWDSIVLDTNTMYVGVVTLLNESVNPAEDITKEVEEEADEHIFCYAVDGVEVNYDDSDGMHPIGIRSKWMTKDASKGSLTLKLKHQPGGIKDGTCDPGETDVEVTFQIEIVE